MYAIISYNKNGNIFRIEYSEYEPENLRENEVYYNVSEHENFIPFKVNIETKEIIFEYYLKMKSPQELKIEQLEATVEELILATLEV